MIPASHTSTSSSRFAEIGSVGLKVATTLTAPALISATVSKALAIVIGPLASQVVTPLVELPLILYGRDKVASTLEHIGKSIATEGIQIARYGKSYFTTKGDSGHLVDLLSYMKFVVSHQVSKLSSEELYPLLSKVNEQFDLICNKALEIETKDLTEDWVEIGEEQSPKQPDSPSNSAERIGLFEGDKIKKIAKELKPISQGMAFTDYLNSLASAGGTFGGYIVAPAFIGKGITLGFVTVLGSGGELMASFLAPSMVLYSVNVLAPIITKVGKITLTNGYRFIRYGVHRFTRPTSQEPNAVSHSLTKVKTALGHLCALTEKNTTFSPLFKELSSKIDTLASTAQDKEILAEFETEDVPSA